MKRLFIYTALFVFVYISGCETEHEVSCFPQRVKTTLAIGTNATSITADYVYDGDLILRIIWSNSQTHYLSYNSEDQLTKIEEFNVKSLVKTEYRISYNGNYLSRVEQYLSTLDYQTQKEVDTSYIAYHTYIHKNGNISAEEVFGRENENQDFVLLKNNEYSYDVFGNLTEMTSMDEISGDTIESYTFIYDLQKNPYNALQLYFHGETFVNNILGRENLLTEETYTYQIIYNPSQYPNQINIKENGYLYQVITFDYVCK